MASFTIDGQGLTRQQKLAMAAALACKPCCGLGGGGSSGGGSPGSSGFVPCCGVRFTPTIISWEVTGITCGDPACLSGTSERIGNPECQYLIEFPPAGWQVRPGEESATAWAANCLLGDILTGFSIDLCCLEFIADPTQTQLWLSIVFTFSGTVPGIWLRQFRHNTNLFDVGSCDAGVLEIFNRPLELTDSVGVSPCMFDDPHISVVIT